MDSWFLNCNNKSQETLTKIFMCWEKITANWRLYVQKTVFQEGGWNEDIQQQKKNKNKPEGVHYQQDSIKEASQGCTSERGKWSQKEGLRHENKWWERKWWNWGSLSHIQALLLFTRSRTCLWSSPLHLLYYQYFSLYQIISTCNQTCHSFFH